MTPPALAEKVFTGAMVWTGDGFEARDIGVAGERIVAPFTTSETTEEFDVSGQYITPPIANAHQHITSATMENSWAFFDAGVYYVWNPNL